MMARPCTLWAVTLCMSALVSSSLAFLAPVSLPAHARLAPDMLSSSRATHSQVSMSLMERRDMLKFVGAASGVLLQRSPVLAEEASDGGAWASHEKAFQQSEFADFKATESGLKYKDVVEGSGEQPKPGETVRAHYAGYLLDGTMFDTSYRPALFPFSLITPSGPPQAFKLEKGALIPGFEEGMLGMKVGGKRIIYVDPKLGYGERGAGSVIPPNSPLVFYLELRSIGSKLSL